MAAQIINPMLQAEPYEMTQGPRQAASPNELQAFYQDMEKKDLERKLSKRNSIKAHSLWSRRSLKRSASNPANTAPSQPPTKLVKPQQQPPQALQAPSEEEKDMESLEEARDKVDQPPTQNGNLSNSIIPDPLKELPAWYNKDSWAANGLMPPSKPFYPLHNPIGPRWYRNHHLIPPSQRQRSARPPSVFSPSFPPLPFSQHDSSDEYRAGPSRTPSGSPLPTPTSSETRVGDTGKPRSRKTSQTAHDNVDLLDVSDPWGTNWHHQSPYDIGLGNGPVSVDVHENRNQTRSRLSSMGTTQSRHRSVVPSPLSQSTSAVHLQVPEPDHSHIRLPRKLSKRRTPTVDNLFPSEPPPETERNAISLPTTPTEHPVAQDQPTNALELSRRTSNLNAPGIPPSSASQISGKKEKRGSVLGRIVKKFSILKGRMGDKQEDSDMHSRNDVRKSFVVGGRQASPERPPMEPRRSADPPKRVPPPPLEKAKPPEPPTPPARKSIEKDQHDRASLISVDVPYWGRLTITNPDAPSSGGNTPTQREAPLPPEKHFPPNVHSSPSPPPAPSPATMTLPIEHTPRHDTLSPPSIMPPLSMGESPLLPPIPPLSPAPPPTPDKVDSSRTHTPHERPFSSSLSLPTIPTPAPQGHIPFPISPPLPPDMSIMNASPMTIPSLFDYGDSPLSSLSILANPGTPHNPEMSMPPSVAPPVVPLRPSNEGSPLARQVYTNESAQASQSSKISRQTETFKLVRSASGNVYSSADVIQGEGEQWEVVESRKDVEASRDASRDRPTKSRSKDREREDRDREREREREREKEKERERERAKEKERERREREAEREREREKERAKEREREKEKERAREKERERDRKERERAKEAEREKEKEREKRKERERERERESSKKEKERDSERDSRRDKRRHDKERSKTDSERDRDKPPATRRSSHDAHGSSRHGKTLSLEVNTGSEPSSSRKEESSSRSKRSSDKRDSEKDSRSNRKSSSKDKEKDKEGSKSRNSSSHKSLERANSSSTRPTSELPSTAELNALRAREAWDMERLWKARSMYGPDPSNMVPAPSSIGTSASYIDPSVASAVHGSSHTAFVIPTPFQQHPQTGHIYHSMPNGPPPIFYAAPHTTQYQHQPQQYPQHYTRAYPIMDPLPPIASRSNPLPEPPRESSYDPAHLAAPILDSHGRPTGKWTNNTKYSGVTTTH